MNNERTIIELEAQISALKKQIKNITENSKKKEDKLNSRIKTLEYENNNLMELLKLSKKKIFGAVDVGSLYPRFGTERVEYVDESNGKYGDKENHYKLVSLFEHKFGYFPE